jgi:hypothetical protein
MMFSSTSRYSRTETAVLITEEGRELVHLRRRFLPDPKDASILSEHSVCQGDRLDNITALYLGDPEQFWRICDANLAMQPRHLTAEIGRKLKIPLIQGD